jgi:hypothetical protein
VRLQQRPDGGACLVVAERRDQDHGNLLGGGQQRGQGGATRVAYLSNVFEHRGGRVRAQPADLPVHVAVEKSITHDDQRACRAHGAVTSDIRASSASQSA